VSWRWIAAPAAAEQQRRVSSSNRRHAARGTSSRNRAIFLARQLLVSFAQQMSITAPHTQHRIHGTPARFLMPQKQRLRARCSSSSKATEENPHDVS
jgi:hypothetical protein